MLHEHVKTGRGRRRHLSTVIGPHLDGYLTRLHRQGFARATVESDLKWATSFGQYLSEARRPLAEVLDADLDAFLTWYRATPHRTGPPRRQPGGSTSMNEALVGSVRKLMAYLRGVGAVPPTLQVDPPSGPYDAAVAGYLDFLVRHRGLATRTVQIHRRWVEALVGCLSRREHPPPLDALTGRMVEDVVAGMAAGLGQRSRQLMTSAIEALLRYLRDSGQVARSCRPFLPRRRSYALASLPTALPWEAVERALGSTERTSAMGRRDYAVLVLVATYGLRASEVADLTLDDIDWRNRVVHVRQPKTRRSIALPLLAPVAAAVVDYLRHGRPKTQDRGLFQKCHAPNGRINRSVVYALVSRALQRAEIITDHYGPHALRHARATSLVRGGHPLKIVGDVLGHRVPEATMIYCKLAVEELRGVALELPEQS